MSYHIETQFAQLGNRSEDTTGTVNPPVYFSTAYRHHGVGESTGYDYTRTKNPTRAVLEEGVAKLEQGDEGYATSSGMAAVQLVLSLFKQGEVILASDDIYGGTYRLLKHYEEAYGIQTKYVDTNDLEQISRAICPNTRAIFVETPTNPLMHVSDIEQVAKLAKDHQLLTIVDNTFLTPYLQKPLTLGADIVIHSATKYIGGHNDVLAGLVVAKGEQICERLFAIHNGAGAVLAPLDCWLLMRGLKTLSLRMDRHQENARQAARFLENQPGIKDVLYPGIGGMVSFRLENEEWIDPFLRSLKLITFAESLGGVESFITYPATQTHADIPVEERLERGICNRLLRFSVGIEHIDDLTQDLAQAIAIVQKEETKI
ncbi:methionine biosynthesis PLP-dependent protein [Jeotgalibacillus sp. S-D1]|uniref:methionine biosynthesis PLP-dependent protein n=1 Tax=Jeotgalibacillus sp. S-D1 TaxID=2552189 RepID=UPI0010593882|nr:methionine biosynthesis PLP-dependent protein [Jeotgalibacillus sp. S-D1]TDL31457.1 methionine biosynthesis PLP-dependent protein [Jeotgalibacillus sp. S-D1]